MGRGLQRLGIQGTEQREGNKKTGRGNLGLDVKGASSVGTLTVGKVEPLAGGCIERHVVGCGQKWVRL